MPNAALPDERLYLTATDCEDLTGIKASTFRFWAHVDDGPPSIKLGRRRMWPRNRFMRWLAEQERTSAKSPTV